METDIIATERGCKNCGHRYSGVFCPGCGQRFIDNRITLKDSINAFFAMVINVDRGLWYTTRKLTTQPAKVLRDYLNGITVPYFHPFRFLFLWLTLQVFLMVSTGYMERVQHQLSGYFGDQPYNAVQLEVMHFIYSYMHILLTVSIPLLALCTFLFFRKKGYNYAEHMVIGAFLCGQTVFFSTLLLPLFLLLDSIYLGGITMLLSFLYFTFAFSTFFSGNKLLMFLKAVVIYFLWYLGCMLVAMIAGMAYLLYYLSTHPEAMETLKNSAGA